MKVVQLKNKELFKSPRETFQPAKSEKKKTSIIVQTGAVN
jgi:hypothetical protein